MAMRLYKVLLISIIAIAGNLFSSDWVSLGVSSPSKPIWDVEVISDNDIEINFQLGGYSLETLQNGKKRISFPGGVSILEEGAPSLPRMARSIIIPDIANMELSISKAEFIDIQMSDIEPSKGNLTRDIDPSDIPYTYGKPYELDDFYPGEIAFMREPYILRSLRGQAVVLQPIQYNPIQRLLRVYTKINISIKQNGVSQINPLINRPPQLESREFEHMYSNHFINYPNNQRYDVLSEQGSMLIISHGEFMDEMQSFVDWKNYKGIPTQIVDIADVGDENDMAQFIENQYNENGIAFVLLVGDIDQIETIRRSNGAGSNSPSDNSLTFVAGDDFYPDLIIGRFSAETGEHVETMVNRTIAYEMNPDPTGEWYKKGSGFASNQGPGDDGEDDDEHMDNIRDLLLDYTYIEIDQVYDPNGTVSDGEAAINEGRSIINYTGHGSNGSWGNGCPMNNTDVNGLTNTDKWPFIWSVACVNGEFHQGTCYAETWLRATNDSDGSPTGAIATLMSTVNQAWNPPMEGQDEMNAIFVESYSDNIKRTFGGLSFNGMNQMNDSYGSQGYDETFYWTLFGDPSVVVRSDTPTEMTIVHNSTLIVGATELSVDTGLSGALVAISLDGELLVSGYTDETGSINLSFESPMEFPGAINIIVTAYNKIPYESTINIISPEGAYMLLEDYMVSGGDDELLDYGELGSLSVIFENVGEHSSGELLFNIAHQGSMIDMLTGAISQESIQAGDQTVIGPFEFDVSWNVEDGAGIPLLVTAIGDSGEWEYEIEIPVEAPSFILSSSDLVDNGNGTLDPGESIVMQISLENVGNSPVNYPTFEAMISDSYLTIGSVVSDNAYWWDVGDVVNVSIEITASNDAPIGSSSIIALTIGSLNTTYNHTFPVPITLGIMMEDFETANFSSFDWVHRGDTDWIIDTDSYSGSFSAKSGEIDHNQSSELAVMINVLYEGDIQFWSKASSEQGSSGNIYDYLEFYIDNEPQELIIGGETDWNEYIVGLPIGEHELRWVYEKDDDQSSGDDCAWIDRIQFPPGAVIPLNIDFGDLNFDDIVNILDVIVTVNFVIGHIDINQQQIQNGDMNLDGIINVLDILMIVDSALSE